jgi:hypothetical protein
MFDPMPTIEHLAGIAAAVELSLGEYSKIRLAYRMEIEGAISEYLYSDNVKITKFKNNFGKSVLWAFDEAFRMGLKDGSGFSDEMTADDQQWLNARIEKELGFISDLFQQLKDLKSLAKESDDISILANVAKDKAENYSKTLDGVYGNGKIRGAGDIMLWFSGPDGKESCNTCKRLKKGKPHKASYWKKRGLIVYRGNENYECGCWQCEHYFHDAKGNIYTF